MSGQTYVGVTRTIPDRAGDRAVIVAEVGEGFLSPNEVPQLRVAPEKGGEIVGLDYQGGLLSVEIATNAANPLPILAVEIFGRGGRVVGVIVFPRSELPLFDALFALVKIPRPQKGCTPITLKPSVVSGSAGQGITFTGVANVTNTAGPYLDVSVSGGVVVNLPSTVNVDPVHGTFSFTGTFAQGGLGSVMVTGDDKSISSIAAVANTE